MKKRLLSVLLVLVLCVSFFAGCGSAVLQGGPALNDAISGNGTFAVTKGNYLYFINGYADSSTIATKANVKDGVVNGGLYRATLTSGELVYDDDGNLTSSVELLTDKFVGITDAGLYVFGDYIYFASPNTLSDATGTQRTDLYDFYACKLDGSGLKLIYSTSEYNSGKYTFVCNQSTVYLIVFDGSDIVVVSIANNVRKSIKTVAEDVTSVFMPSVNSVSSLNASLSTNDKYVYYTRNLIEDDEEETNGNVLAKADITSGDEIVLRKDNANIYTLTAYKNNAIYFTMKHYLYGFSATNIYYLLLSDTNIASSAPIQVTATSYTTVLYVDDANSQKRGVVAYDGSRVLYISQVSNEIKTLYVGTANIIDTIGDSVYCLINEKLAKLNITNDSIVYLTDENHTISTTPSKFISIDRNISKIYFYQTFTGDVSTNIGYYLSRCNVDGVTVKVEFIGEMLPKHIKTDVE